MVLVRTFPSSFDPLPDLSAVSHGTPWSSCADALVHFGARTVILQTPFFWQLFSPLHDACRNIQVQIYPNEPENMPAGAEALIRADANVIICAARDAEGFAGYLLAKHYPLPSWILIHRSEDEFLVPPTLQLAPAHVAHEIHETPGKPILVQCAVLIDAPMNEFHSTDTRTPDSRLRENGTCSCGLLRYRYL